MKEIQELIQQLNLSPHPEGGYFKETYRSADSVEVQNELWPQPVQRNYCTGIYFLLTSDTFSAFHRIKQDELWHFYKGDAIRIHMIDPEGQYSHVVLGGDFEKGEVPQYAVPKGIWFAAEMVEQDSYALVGCTVAPGFDFEDFELPSRESLLELFPQHSDIITNLTRV
ncbi:cupin domain-containing protein [Poritiphilus flavus]|uniref:DUF985 domain-containing protein n=1 Tax=Poritiphilus flavus TaxID=2697053 RepID=A0A6L9EFQ6_9FLAO|nr:cupin domain-containing protein [Poritiphilus flavus]NAS13546.1 hypothetical protein [Poritiphilus flavus]